MNRFLHYVGKNKQRKDLEYKQTRGPFIMLLLNLYTLLKIQLIWHAFLHHLMQCMHEQYYEIEIKEFL